MTITIVWNVILFVIAPQIQGFSKALQPEVSRGLPALNNHYGGFDEGRRNFLELTLSSRLSVAFQRDGPIVTAREGLPVSNEKNEEVTVPLKFIPKLNAYVIYFGLFKDEPEKFGAILDTGSPFLTVPSYCNRSRWGCYRPELTLDSGYSNTVERFDNNEGTVVWRKARFSFVGASGSMIGPQDVVFGVLGESLMDGPGGVFFGLIKNEDKRIRPSFLGQLNVKSFKIDFTSNPSLTLKTMAMIDNPGYIPLVSDLNRKYKDPVSHYTAISEKILVNGYLLQPMKFRNKPTYVIFDTGVTGMVVSQELFQERYIMARNNREKSVWPSVEIFFRTKMGTSVSLQATNPIATPLGEKPWPNFNANLIVMGLAFLDDHIITIDIDDQKLQID